MKKNSPKKNMPKKVLVLGSGGLQIGQAGEFDYSGSQAIKALREEGISTVLINPNIATVQTGKGFADKVYFLPLTPEFVERVIKREKPDGILLSFGGQTALNCGLELERSGVLRRHKVRVMGTPVKAIALTEDRKAFNLELGRIGVNVPSSSAVTTVPAALSASEKLGFPVIVRAAFALGGRGSGFAKNREQLRSIAERAFTHSKQILVEECLKGWKEVEYEVVRDVHDNCITVCNMENFDPLGIHTGESIVVAPSQTLNNSEYHMLREISIRVIRHFGIIGECNIQFALDPQSEEYRVIEVNARLSRSSALASKATGYPLAFIAAKLALGYSLTELENKVTRTTKACFEPALDYIVVKIPRWDLQKFRRVSKRIGTEMKSVGEVMAIGRTFEEAMQKAIRMLGTGMNGLVCNSTRFRRLQKSIAYPTDKRIFAVIESLEKGYGIDRIHALSGIDNWFLQRLENVVALKKEVSKGGWTAKTIPRETLLLCKQCGFSDRQIASLLRGADEKSVRARRHELGLRPSVKQIDTLAAEFPARTNYLYLTYNGIEDDVKFPHAKKALVLGSGAYSIGSSVEFDWCCVGAVNALKRHGFGTLMLNCNPETVSTDYDVCDRLYFEEINLETVLEIYGKENPQGVVVSTGGQIPNSLVPKLVPAGVKIFGTPAESIDRAENRHKFSALLDSLGIAQPEWRELTTEKQALEFAARVNYPVLVRPSYVLSGSAMRVAFSPAELSAYLREATSVSAEYPVVISKFILGAREIEIDAVASKGELAIWAITEHVENAGVHSGDATMVLPPQRTNLETVRRIKQIARMLAAQLRISGPFNMQFLAKDNNVLVIEMNLRASRSFPFVSKVSGTDFIETAIGAMLGAKAKHANSSSLGHGKAPHNNSSSLELDHVGVKVPQFSFSRLHGADPKLGVEMASTGEVACIGPDLEDAFLKAMLSAGYSMPKKNMLVSISGDRNREKLLDAVKAAAVAMRLGIFATENTARFLRANGVQCSRLFKAHENKKPNVLGYLRSGGIDFAICVPDPQVAAEMDGAYLLRRAAVDYSIPLITDAEAARLFLKAISVKKPEELDIRPWQEYF